ncbi:MAG: tetratricopeptide repeat protein, partial [Candidatus Omnitrophota bacterium]
SFRPCLSNGVTNWDDNTYLTHNPVLLEPWPGNLKTMFLSSYCEERELKPLVVLSFAIERLWAGHNPFWYHLTNLLLHLFNTALVFLLFLRLGTRRMSVAFWTAALFALHPLRVESVAWIAERKDVLYAFFWFLSVGCYLRFCGTRAQTDVCGSIPGVGRHPRPVRAYLLAVLFFILAVMVKPIALTLPAILLLFDYLQKRPISRSMLTDKIPFAILAVSLGSLLLAGQAEKMQRTWPGANFLDPQFYSTATYAIWFYLSKIFWPANLSCVYPSPSKTGLLFDASPLILIAAVSLVFYSARKNRALVFGLGFFLISLIPPLEMISVNVSFVQDRYTYLASLGIGYILAAGFVGLSDRLKGRWPGSVCLALAFLSLCQLGTMTSERCRVWRNSFTLWTDVIEKYPWMSVSYNGRGIDRLFAGDLAGALNDFDRAIAREKKSVTAVNNRGVVYMRMRQHRRAYADFTRAGRLIRAEAMAARTRSGIIAEPDLGEVYFNRGAACVGMGRLSEAAADYTQALRYKSHDPQLFKSRGDVYTWLKKPAEAVADYSRAIEIDGSFAEALNNRGTQLMLLGRYPEAVSDFIATLATRSDPAAAANLEKASRVQNDYRRYTDEILREPSSAKAFYNRGTFFADTGAHRGALIDLGRAIELDPSLAEAYVNRGSVYQELEMPSEALADYDHALALKPDLAQARHNRQMLQNKASYNR